MKDMKAIIIQKTNLGIETPIEYPEDYWEGLEPHEPYEPYEIHAEIETDLVAAQNDLFGELEYDQEVFLPRRTL
jgi:hypothetical protein